MKNLIQQFILFLKGLLFPTIRTVPHTNQPDDKSVGDVHDYAPTKARFILGVDPIATGDIPVNVFHPEIRTLSLPDKILDFMVWKGYKIDRYNIVYLKNDGYGNFDRDAWNDLRMIIREDANAEIVFQQQCSTEPGEISRMSANARKLGGVATIVPGQYKAWKIGFHKNDFDHPALVQCADVTIWRDSNRDSYSEGEEHYTGMFGINQHSTKPGFTGKKVGPWSAGCLVAPEWEMHLKFMEEVEKRFGKDKVITTTIIDSRELNEWYTKWQRGDIYEQESV